MKKIVSIFFLAFLIAVNGIAQVDNYSVKLTDKGYIQINPIQELNQLDTYTLQFWFNPGTWTPGAAIFTRDTGVNSFAIRLGSAQGELIFTSGTKTTSLKSATFTTNKWNQISIINKPTQIRIYVNNNLISTLSEGFTIPNSNENFYLGQSFDGRIDEFRIWNAEVNNEYLLWRNTLNKHHPQWDNLILYYKFDQNLCENVVDYKFKHHGVFSKEGSTREIVSDNELFKYRITSAYTDFSRFADRVIDKDKYLLANDLIILGIKTNEAGEVTIPYPDNQGTVTNGEHLSEFKGRQGVLALNGAGAKMDVGFNALIPTDKYTFHTWIYLEEWTEGAFIFKKELNDTNGFSIRLGNKDNKEIIVRLNGNEYIRPVTTAAVPEVVGSWWHLAVAAFDNTLTPNRNFLFVFNGKAYFPTNANAPATSPSNFLPNNVSEVSATVGENLNAKLDETVIWHTSWTDSQIRNFIDNGLPMPGFDVVVTASTIHSVNSFWKYDNPENIGYDSYSYKHFINIMRQAYEGHRGYKIRMSVGGGGESSWQAAISNYASRNKMAQNIVKAAEEFDGIDIDFEWCYDATCFNNYGLLIKAIGEKMPANKVFTVTPHVVSYKIPSQYFQYVDYFLFQMYGPQPTHFKWNSFKNSYNNFVAHGYPKHKMSLSFATTTSRATDDPEGNSVTPAPPIGVRNGLLDGDYTPDKDVVMDSNGKYRFITGFNQTRNRAEFVQDEDLRGIFYWDMGNDVLTSHKYSLVKSSSYAIASNVDTLVTHVDMNPSNVRLIKKNQNITIYPNPASDFINILFPDSDEISAIRIYDATGKCVLSDVNVQDGNRINISMCREGLYLLRMETKSGRSFYSGFIKK